MINYILKKHTVQSRLLIQYVGCNVLHAHCTRWPPRSIPNVIDYQSVTLFVGGITKCISLFSISDLRCALENLRCSVVVYMLWKSLTTLAKGQADPALARSLFLHNNRHRWLRTFENAANSHEAGASTSLKHIYKTPDTFHLCTFFSWKDQILSSGRKNTISLIGFSFSHLIDTPII